VVRRGLPGSFQQFDLAQFLQSDATPVLQGAHGGKAALTFAAILITKNAKLFSTIPPQAMWAEQSRAVFVDGGEGLFAGNRSPNQSVDILHSLDLRLDDSHRLSRYRARGYLIESPQFITQ
jgi:hypothetical protein